MTTISPSGSRAPRSAIRLTRSTWSGCFTSSGGNSSCQSGESSSAVVLGWTSIPRILTKMCWIRPDSEQELHIGIVCTAKRTAPLVVSVHVGLGSLALMPIVPVGGLEVKVKHVLLQPVSQTANNNAAGNAKLQQLRQRERVFSAKITPIRHPRAGGSFRRPISHSGGSAPRELISVRPTTQSYAYAAL